MISRVQPRKSTAQQISDFGKTMTAVFFALCFIAFIAFMVYALWQ
jgi:hypothetical protein